MASRLLLQTGDKSLLQSGGATLLQSDTDVVLPVNGNRIALDNPVADHPLNRGLVSWCLPLSNNSGGGTLFDLSPTGRNHGTLVNAPTWTVGPTGAFGALTFNGSSQYGILPFTMGAAVSWFGWAKFTNFTGATIVKNWSQPDAGAFHFDAGATPGQLSLYTDNGTTTVNITDPGSLSTGVWYRVGFAIGAGAYRIYRDGLNVVSGTYTGTVRTDRPNIGYGVKLNSTGTAEAATNPFWLTGSLCDGRLYSVAVTDDIAWSDYAQSLRDYPDLLRRVPTATWISLATSPPPPPATSSFVPAFAAGWGW